MQVQAKIQLSKKINIIKKNYTNKDLSTIHAACIAV